MLESEMFLIRFETGFSKKMFKKCHENFLWESKEILFGKLSPTINRIGTPQKNPSAFAYFDAA